MEEARKRDPAALAALCTRLYPDLVRYMRYRVDREDAEDLAGEVLVRVLRSIDGQTGSLPAWVFTIAGNVVKDHYRRRGSTREEAMSERIEGLPDRGRGEEESVNRRIDLEEAVARLTGDQREVVALRFAQGLSTAEAARVMERSPGAVRVLQFRALSALREILGGGR